jgi:hypothetical protein
VPTKTSADAGADQIAKHVGPLYRLPTGEQLVLVTGGPLALKVSDLNLPVRIAVNGGGSSSAAGGSAAGGSSAVGGGGTAAGGDGTSSAGAGDSISVVDGKTVMYQLCGLGPRCAIAKGRPSTERFLLLRREALELALYSFHYLDGIKNVVALLPPAPGEKPQNAMFFRKGDLAPALGQPLRATLPDPPPTLRSLPGSPEASLIERLTSANLFSYSFQQGQDLSAFLVLNRRPAQ